MDDDLKRFRQAMDETTPEPSAKRRAENLDAALKKFDLSQGLEDPARLTQDRAPQARGFLRGLKKMITGFKNPISLAATSSLAVASVAAFAVLPNVNWNPAPPLPAPVSDFQGRALESDVADLAVTQELEAAPVATPLPSREEAATARIKRAPVVQQSQPQHTESIGAGAAYPEADTEAYSNDVANRVVATSENSVSTFSIDVDTASYSLIRSSLTNGRVPPADAVRVEEMINYFPYDYAPPVGENVPFSTSVAVFATPWNSGTQLMRIGLQGKMPLTEDRPPLNLVFLIDTSGSMEAANKLPLLIQAFGLMLRSLDPLDEVAIVTYAGSAGEVLAPTPAGERDKIMAALQNLSAGGSTAGQAGLQQAYAVAEKMTQDGEVNRVILATDGDFNVGISDPEALKEFIAEKSRTETYLSVLGFGRGNLDDRVMQTLAQNGNGHAAYIDTLAEAQKVLNDQLSGALFPIANDVKVQVEFNPAMISEYRLIGYETRILARADFNNDAVDAGEVGAGHQVTAVYEITPVGSPATLNDPLRYGAETPVENPNRDEIAFVKLRYKVPGEAESRLLEMPVAPSLATPDQDGRFAAAIAGFGQLLRGSSHMGDWGYQEAIDLANGAKGNDPFGYRAEAITLMRLAKTLTEN
ncbi:VWA domain-containing protein [uncultured Roseobacter sp.]|uniref:vWA domain-containing protein n=1 Tax=uncultured Roseobacter sp. TaxID=114847 RepID=UPI00261A165D|nr:VWA domain-containing protein [uncultured Roseobacter sp.]